MSDLTVPSPSVRVSTPAQTVAAKAPASAASTAPAQPAVNSSPVATSSSATNFSAEQAGGSQGTSTSVNQDSRPDTVRSSQAAASSGSSILTVRDSDTGQLIVKLIDKDNNAVITQFPSVTQLSNYPKINNNQIQPNTIDEKI